MSTYYQYSEFKLNDVTYSVLERSGSQYYISISQKGGNNEPANIGKKFLDWDKVFVNYTDPIMQGKLLLAKNKIDAEGAELMKSLLNN